MITEETIRYAFSHFGTDKGKSHGYERYYKEFITENTKSILEIGVKAGNSLRAWRHLLPEVLLYGIDITDKWLNRKAIDEARANIVITDSTMVGAGNLLPQNFDVIIDDGSHNYKDIIATFNNYHHRFNHHYIIEDAMYKQEEVVNFIKSMGYDKVKMLPSYTKNVPVDINFLEEKSSLKSGKTVPVSLFMIVVER